MKILVINAGSSSLKYQLIDMKDESVIAKGNCEKIGLESSFIKHKTQKGEIKIDKFMPTHNEAIELVLSCLLDKEHGAIKSLDEIGAVGHRVLHGGEIYTDSVLVDDEVMKNLESLKPLGPLHMPANIMGIKACQKVMPNVKNVAVFDTAFHSKMPKEAFLYAVPYEAYTENKVRRYGFHGTSHKYVSNEAAKLLGKDLKDCKIITIHLGNGSSMAAVRDGRSIDTSMGYTPLEGLLMGTRSGDVDASVLEVLAEKYNLKTISECVTFLNKKCGVLGINGVSPDMRDNEEEAEKGNERAKLVYSMLGHRIKKYIGAYFALLNGVDALVFTGGVGENDALVRELATNNLDAMGIVLDKEKNSHCPRGTNEVLSTSDSKVKIFRIPTNEELVIARDTLSLTK